jgi:hypothetical protein
MRGPAIQLLPLFSVQIVFGPNASYSMDGKGLAALRKVLYRTPVVLDMDSTEIPVYAPHVTSEH